MSTPFSAPRIPFTRPSPTALREVLHRRDLAAFRGLAHRNWPGAGPVLPRLSRSADHGLLWLGAAAGLAALGGNARARRAALRGIASLGVASAVTNVLGKSAVRRQRPLLDAVPVVRQLARQPVTTSFPSGHAASAAAFATGVALESKGWGAVVAPLALSVAASRVYTGVHYPSDVLAGAVLGVGAALALRGVVPTRGQLPAPGRPPAHAPALPTGQDLVVVVNEESGTATATAALVRSALPDAEVVECAPDELSAELEKAAGRGRALGVCGGDGTVNRAAAVAALHGVPLAVFPGGTLNHFAYDLGIETVDDTCTALIAGDAVRVDLGRFRPGPEGPGGAHGYFLNAFSMGVYPELVRARERWAPKVGGWPHGRARGLEGAARGPSIGCGTGGAAAPAVAAVRGQRDVPARGSGTGPSAQPRGRPAGRPGGARRPCAGAAPARRGRRGSAHPLPVHAAQRRHRVRITGLTPGTPYAFDGEVAYSQDELWVDKLPEALTVYCPMPV